MLHYLFLSDQPTARVIAEGNQEIFGSVRSSPERTASPFSPCNRVHNVPKQEVEYSSSLPMSCFCLGVSRRESSCYTTEHLLNIVFKRSEIVETDLRSM